jgi:hypothetical protein
MSPSPTELKSVRLRRTSHPARASPRSGPGVWSTNASRTTRQTPHAPPVASAANTGCTPKCGVEATRSRPPWPVPDCHCHPMKGLEG